MIRSFLDREVPTAADPGYVDGSYDRTTVEMTRSVLESNSDRLLDATADLYVPYERIRTRFGELTDRERWSAAEELPPG